MGDAVYSAVLSMFYIPQENIGKASPMKAFGRIRPDIGRCAEF
jgi:hypothetical protein